MKKFLILFFITYSVVIIPYFSFGDNGKYTPLAPIPGLSDNVAPIDTENGLSIYVNQLYTWGVALASGLAVMMIIWGGVGYVTSAGGGGIEEAKGRINAAILGLLLALGSYLILKTINPELLKTTFDLATITVNTTTQNGNGGNGGFGGTNPTTGTITGDYAFLNQVNNDPNGDQILFTAYGYAGDTSYDQNSAEGRGNNDNQLTEGSVALSPDLISKLNPSPGASVFVNGVHVGYYDDSTSPDLTNRVDFYNPSGSLGGNNFSKPVTGTVTVDNSSVRPQKPNPSKK